MKKLLSIAFLLGLSSMVYADIWNEAEHHYADSNGVKIHYVSAGQGPLVVMIHGFPDFWYSWRHQLVAEVETIYSKCSPAKMANGLVGLV